MYITQNFARTKLVDSDSGNRPLHLPRIQCCGSGSEPFLSDLDPINCPDPVPDPKSHETRKKSNKLNQCCGAEIIYFRLRLRQ